MFNQGFQKFYGSITEAKEAPETIFQQRGGACRPVASSLSNPKIAILTTKTFEIIRLPLVSFPHTRSLPHIISLVQISHGGVAS